MCAHKNGDDVPHGTIAATQITPAKNPLQIAGHLAIWASAYSVGVAIILGEFLNRPIGFLELAYVALCAHSGYLFDRIKFRDADLDPADLMADPRRHLFLRQFTKPLRILMVTEWIGAMAIGSLISPILGILVLGGIVAGYLYSGWRPVTNTTGGHGHGRLKDLPGLKAGLVGCSVVGLGLAAIFGAELPLGGADFWDRWMKLFGETPWIIVVGVLVMVCGDAVICDLDDRESDGKYFTQSLPVMIGMRPAALVAAGLLVAGGLLVVVDAGDEVRMRALFGAMVAVSGIGIMRQQKRRDWIDGRMLIVVLSVMLAG